MRRISPSVCVGFLIAAVLFAAAPVFAQQRASIVGLVTDTSGAVLPGVTVEAASPVLIEKVRSAVTDGSGRYTIIDLLPGTYTVSFELSGFNRTQREGIILQGAFTAQVNMQMTVGSLEETITVTGASPVVDVQSTQNQAVLNRDIIDVLPAARTMQGGASLVPGVSFYSQGFRSEMSVHGSTAGDQHIYFDGMNIGQNLTGTGSQANGVNVNELAQSELVYDAGAQTAETPLGGVRMDSIPREGGNNFSGIFRTFGSRGAWQNDNITDELRPFIQRGTRLGHSYEVNSVFGGPVKRDKLWFLLAQRVTQTNNIIPLLPQYIPQGGFAESGGAVAPHSTVRLTYQATQRDKIVFAFYKSQGGTQRFDVGCSATSGNTVACVSPEAAYHLPTPLQYAAQAKYTAPLTSRWLLEIGQSLAVPTYKFKYQPEVGPYDVGRLNVSTGVRTVASSTAPQDYFNEIWNSVANMSYVTGSHNIKFGINHQWGYSTLKVEPNGDMQTLRVTNVNGIETANSVDLRNTPFIRKDVLKANLGIFAQDKWTTNRLTMMYGARYDYFNGMAPAQTAPAGRFVPARTAPETPCIPCWHDWSIRLGGSYDIFGNGKTALKASVGKFLAQQALGLTGTLNPMTGQTDRRAWTDRDGNGRALDANGLVQSNEIGASTNLNFGIPGASARIAEGLPRGINWEESVSIQHELVPRVAVTGGYYRRHFSNLQYSQNRSLDPAVNFTPFQVVIPVHPNNPDGGGQVITMYNLRQQVVPDNVTSWSNNNTRVYNGFEMSVNARVPRGFVFGAITTERTETNNCTDLSGSNPNTPVAGISNLAFCNQRPPFRTLYKGSAGFTLPFAVNVSGSFQARYGITKGADYVYTCSAAQAAATGCTPLTAGVANLTVTVVDPATLFYPYVYTNDFRVARRFQHGRMRLEPFVEIFNLMNLSTVLTVNETISANSRWNEPTAVLQPRRFQIGGRIDW
jgi:hypothetical protein